MGSKKSIGNKGLGRQYPMYAPHIILGTNTSIFDVLNIRYMSKTASQVEADNPPPTPSLDDEDKNKFI